MPMFVSAIITIFAFGVMVMLHELGHFLMAKKFGVRVHEFSIGMGPLIFKWGKNKKQYPDATQYSLRLLPLGGYVKLEGESEESDDPKAFSNISPLKRIVILVAGATMNIILGFICFMVIHNVHGYVTTNTIDAVTENSAVAIAGLQEGDSIVKLNKTNVNTFEDIKLYMMDAPESVEVTYLRDGKKYTAVVNPVTESDGQKYLGYYPTVKKLNFIQSVEYSYYSTRYVVKAVMYSLKSLVKGDMKVSDMSGPVGVVKAVEETATEVAKTENGLYVFLNLLNLFAMISVNLGVFNLLPFPALDGGSIIFAFIELVTRKKLKQEVLGYINLIGLVLILGLGIFVMYSDIVKLF